MLGFTVVRDAVSHMINLNNAAILAKHCKIKPLGRILRGGDPGHIAVVLPKNINAALFAKVCHPIIVPQNAKSRQTPAGAQRLGMRHIYKCQCGQAPTAAA